MSKWLRIATPVLIIFVWLTAAGIGGPYFGRIDEVSSNDISTFLPKTAESTEVREELERFQTSNAIPAIVVFESESDLTIDQRQQVLAAKGAMQGTGVAQGAILEPIIADDGKAAFLVVSLDSASEVADGVEELKSAVADSGQTLDYKFTGPAIFSGELNKAFAGIDGTLLLVALSVVFVILLIVYRSPILPIVTLGGAMMALASAILLVWHLAEAGVIQLNGQVQGILFILVIGAATDYSLLYIARYREELKHYESSWEATKAALKGSWEPIVAAGGTVSLGLLCLLASDLGSNKALGPVGAIGVVFAVTIALTFLPAALFLLGRVSFWPRRPHYEPKRTQDDYASEHPVWSRIGSFVVRRHRPIWIVVSILLLAAVYFVPQFKAEGVAQTELVVGPSEARDGQAMLDRHFASGSGSPAEILVDEASWQDVAQATLSSDGVDDVSVYTVSNVAIPYETWRAARNGISARLEQPLPAAAELELEAGYTQLEPKIVDGVALVEATLSVPASSIEAREKVAALRASLEQDYPSVRIGGLSALQLDTNTASDRDLRVVLPLILVVITLVLAFLLRAIVAPIVLLLTTVVSFGTTIGISALLFNHVWQYAGADPAIVIFGFVFLVALGIDYNIFLMTRVREETAKRGVQKGTLKAVVVTGGVITSAGVVLAATFAALDVIPILFLAQIAFIVAFGVLLDTLIVRTLLVPALTLELGRWMWWPSKLANALKRKK